MSELDMTETEPREAKEAEELDGTELREEEPYEPEDTEACDTDDEEHAEAIEADEAGYTDRSEDDEGEIDYAELVREDLMSLGREFPEMRGAGSITELKNPLRYAALRDLGLTPREAYLATGGKKRAHDTRGHLSSAVPRGAGAPRGTMSRSELERARELFPGLGDRELMGLYKKVSV